MSRTDIDPATLAKALRQMAGDGSIEWVRWPIQASVLLDVADALDENDRLRERITTQKQTIQAYRDESREWREVAERAKAENAKLRELVRDYKRCSVHTDCAGCEYDGKPSKHCPYSPCFSYADELCELGIEVPE